MTVDISKIRPGDKVTISGVVSAVRDASIDVVPDRKIGAHWRAFVHLEDIVSHTPAPRAIEVGGWVTLAAGGGYSGGPVKVLAVTDDEACLLSHGGDRMFVQSLKSLTGSDAPPPR